MGGQVRHLHLTSLRPSSSVLASQCSTSMSAAPKYNSVRVVAMPHLAGRGVQARANHHAARVPIPIPRQFRPHSFLSLSLTLSRKPPMPCEGMFFRLSSSLSHSLSLTLITAQPPMAFESLFAAPSLDISLFLFPVQPPLLCAGWATYPVLKHRRPLCPMPCMS
jgi:hypothetical protein